MAVATNPVIPGFFPDPSICRVGDTYYLATSSFEYLPGIPIHRSTDLVSWEHVGNVAVRSSQLSFPVDMPASGGVYAPTLRHRDGTFYLVVTSVGGGGNVIYTATDPAGPWSDPLPLPGIDGIDPDLAWADDGSVWCTTAGISQARIDPTTGATLSPQSGTWSGSEGAQAPEAPHLYQIGEWWYLVIAEGGTERGHAVSVARGPSPTGPFEACPDNPVLTHRGTHWPIQNTGHADLFQAHDGSWWMVLLGARPRGGTPGWHVLGRETFLTPVVWDDGWPYPARVTPEVEVPWDLAPVPAAPTREDFDGARLGPAWVSPGRFPDEVASLSERAGWLTVRAGAGEQRRTDHEAMRFVAQRQRDHRSRARARIDATGGTGGLTIWLDETHHYEVLVDGRRVTVRSTVGTVSTVVAEIPLRSTTAVVGIDTVPTDAGWDPRMGPDSVVFHAGASEDTLGEIARLEGRYLSTEVAGGFTGRVIGPCATEGAAAFDWFSLTAGPSPIVGP